MMKPPSAILLFFALGVPARTELTVERLDAEFACAALVRIGIASSAKLTQLAYLLEVRFFLVEICRYRG